MALTVGARFGAYEIAGLLGAGGMGEVYRARDTKLRRDVALKVLPDQFARDPDRLARFTREAHVLATLNHPNIASIYGIEEADGVAALVLELVEGPTLAERLSGVGADPRVGLKGGHIGPPLRVDDALKIAAQIADALEAAHEKGIVHRDLKPANIKLTADERVKVLDFGLAKAMAPGDASPAAVAEGDLSPTMSPTLTAMASKLGVIVGTAAYMSPEQAKGKAVDKRTDIWAFGCVLYEMLTGQRAFVGEDVTDFVVAVMTKEPDWSSLPASTPPRLVELLKRCLKKDARERLRDIGDARIEIGEVSGAPAHVSGRDDESHVSVQPKRRTWALATAVALVTALATAGVVAILLRAPHRQGAVRLVVTLPAGESLNIETGAAVTISPDGSRLAFVARRGTATQLYTRPIDDFAAKPIPNTENALMPFFSPDGQWIGFFADNRLKKVPAAGGPVTSICEAGAPWGGTWGVDGNIYFAERWHGESLLRVAAAGGTPQVISRPNRSKDESSYRWPHALPGGGAVLFTIGRGTTFDDARIAVFNTKTGETKTLIEGGTSPQLLLPGYLAYVRSGTLFAVPFDSIKLEIVGTTVPLVEGITTNRANGDAQFSLSRNGSLVYVPGGATVGDRKLLWVNRAGVVRSVTDVRRPYEDLSLSPDGKRLALTIEGPLWNVWVYDLERGTLAPFTYEYTNTDPVWAPDGRRIAFTSYRDGKYGLFWKPADGSGPEERLTASENFHLAYSFSRDGRFLAYEEQTSKGNFDLWVLPMDGDRKPRPFVRTPFENNAPAFSPDGRWIAFMSTESGHSEIYVQPFPGPGGKVQISTTGGDLATWAATGRELFYRDGDKVLVVPIDTQSAVRPGTPRVLFEVPRHQTGHPYDPSPDGQSFVLITPGEPQASLTQIHVVLNLREDLERRAAAGAR
jgi:serine/threonine-protein kinase